MLFYYYRLKDMCGLTKNGFNNTLKDYWAFFL